MSQVNATAAETSKEYRQPGSLPLFGLGVSVYFELFLPKLCKRSDLFCVACTAPFMESEHYNAK